jgi:topoisomerase IA-like protein
METMTEEDANKYTAFPKVVGQHDGDDVIVKKGRYGYYLSHNNQNYKFKEGMDEYLSLADALKCIIGTVKTTILKEFNKTAMIKSGQYGPYIQIGKKIASIPKKYSSEEEIAKLDLATCKEIVELKNKAPPKKKYVKK